MLICKKCGTENPLGRIFCGSCGEKLDLTHMSSGAVAEAQKVAWIRRHISKIVACVVIAVLVITGLALWPKTATIGKKGTRLGGRRMEIAINSIERLRKGDLLGLDFTEKDINGYFEFFKTKKLKADSVSVSVRHGCMALRMVRTLTRWQMSKFEIVPKISCDVLCVPEQGGRVKVSKASIGHLPLLGPAKMPVVRAMREIVAGQKEWAGFEYLADIKMDEEKVSVLIKK